MLLRQPELGHALRGLREKRGLSMRELGAAADCSHNAIHAIETGRVKTPRPKAWRKICRVLRIEVSYFKTKTQKAILTKEQGVAVTEPPELSIEESGQPDHEEWRPPELVPQMTAEQIEHWLDALENNANTSGQFLMEREFVRECVRLRVAFGAEWSGCSDEEWRLLDTMKGRHVPDEGEQVKS
jgi:transcriptional regulator with XRE-family HTH domain